MRSSSAATSNPATDAPKLSRHYPAVAMVLFLGIQLHHLQSALKRNHFAIKRQFFVIDIRAYLFPNRNTALEEGDR